MMANSNAFCLHLEQIVADDWDGLIMIRLS